MKIGEIRQIALAVKDLDDAVAFYQDTMGFELLFTAAPEMAFLDLQGIRLMLSRTDEVSAGGPILYFSVAEIDKTYQEIKARGANCIREPLLTHAAEGQELWLAFLTDPDGHTLALMEERSVA